MAGQAARRHPSSHRSDGSSGTEVRGGSAENHGALTGNDGVYSSVRRSRVLDSVLPPLTSGTTFLEELVGSVQHDPPATVAVSPTVWRHRRRQFEYPRRDRGGVRRGGRGGGRFGRCGATVPDRCCHVGNLDLCVPVTIGGRAMGTSGGAPRRAGANQAAVVLMVRVRRAHATVMVSGVSVALVFLAATLALLFAEAWAAPLPLAALAAVLALGAFAPLGLAHGQPWRSRSCSCWQHRRHAQPRPPARQIPAPRRGLWKCLTFSPVSRKIIAGSWSGLAGRLGA